MSQINDTLIDYDVEIEAVDSAIVARKSEIDELINKRYELIAQKYDLDMREVIECLFESDLTPNEVMELIKSAIKNKQK